MASKTLYVELPEGDVDFMEAYARRHGKSVADLLGMYIRHLRQRESRDLHPEVTKMTGIIPKDIDVSSQYLQHMVDKHR